MSFETFDDLVLNLFLNYLNIRSSKNKYYDYRDDSDQLLQADYKVELKFFLRQLYDDGERELFDFIKD